VLNPNAVYREPMTMADDLAARMGSDPVGLYDCGVRPFACAGESTTLPAGVMRALLDWIFTIPFVVAFGLILLVFDVAQRIARVFGPRPHEYVVGALQWVAHARLRHLWHAAAYRPVPARATAHALPDHRQPPEHVRHPDLRRAAVHQLPEVRLEAVAGKWIPSISYNLRRGGNALIDRGDPEQAVGAIQQLAAEVRARGVSAVIFPEGTRARHGELGKFRRRGALALLDAAPDTAVVPVCIDQSWRLLRHNLLPVPFGTRVHVWIGDPIPRRPDEDREALLAAVEDAIRAVLHRHRAGTS